MVVFYPSKTIFKFILLVSLYTIHGFNLIASFIVEKNGLKN